ncbi:DUF4199 domain-containing protein [Sinomicrobium weinanense]|uniref:DUF4199 domain-containing protein n=1 Tax=Sinomicrobium weinanense TaxID=2842200 RepID=A0A926JP19_9FLAO|nr:DUF4199 domain-containing protein [Sinomicrobium weinanense]MBC9794734.1 DUF4199 domain-containing protein [Sinomicrobium weinanense]MBU3124993.1 DUF4199 domain-containing protein [Sinomicrobium weinanense]
MKKRGIEIKWGILFAVIGLIWMILERSMGLHDENIEKHATYTNFFGILAVAVFVAGLLDKRKNYYNGVMSWKQGFISGLVITLIITILSPITSYITHTYITPGYFPNMQEYTVETGKMTQEIAGKYFSLGSYILQSAIFGLVAGVITSAVVALFVRKKAKIEPEGS